MIKPRIITEIENQCGIQLSTSSAASLETFMRYGYREKDKNQYLLDGERVIGLNLRTNDLTDFPFLSDPALCHLKALNLSENKITSLQIPGQLSELELLDLSDNSELKELSFDGTMPQLKVLDISDSSLQALELPDCPNLDKLDASRNKLETLSFSASYKKLNWLDLSGNKELVELSLPAGFEALEFLHLSNGGLQHLTVEGSLPSLRVLDLKNNQIERLPADIILDSPLINLYAENNSPKNIPRIFLGGDSLDEARTWFQELRDSPSAENQVVKLMLTGNGNVGKTTLMCALKSGVNRCICENDHSSTHGIQIGTWEQPDIQYNYWDFGGQEVYHGTHQLFLASEALQLIVFDPRTEKEARLNKRVKDRVRKDQLVFHHPIEYWYETAEELSSRSQFLIVQNKIGEFPKRDERVSAYADRQDVTFLRLDAKTGKNVEDLVYYLKRRAVDLPDYRMVMPASWLRVRQFFINNLKKEKPERLITKSYFEDTLCKDIASKSRELLFQYLHHSGFLYYHSNLGNQIIADQRWALDAIYKPLERSEDHFEDFREDLEGKIRVKRLFQEFGPDYSNEEKWLFLSFMESCKLCFKLNQEHNQGSKPFFQIFMSFPSSCLRVNRIMLSWIGILGRKGYTFFGIRCPGCIITGCSRLLLR